MVLTGFGTLVGAGRIRVAEIRREGAVGVVGARAADAVQRIRRCLNAAAVFHVFGDEWF